MGWGRTVALAAALGIAPAAGASAKPPASSFSATRPVNWVSVAAGHPTLVWAETAAGGFLSDDAGRSFRAPLSTSAFRQAQVAQATFLADGAALLAMPAVWSAQQFSPPRWSADGGVTWHPGTLRGPDAHYDFGNKPGFVGESPVVADPTDARTAWFCQGNLYVTHDAGRSWSVATPRLKRPWHCATVAIAPARTHTLILVVQATGKNPRRVPSRLLRSVDAGATWHRLKAPRYPQLAYNGRTVAFDPSLPSTALMIGANGTKLGALYRSTDTGLSWKLVRPAGTLRGAVVDQFAFTSDGRALVVMRIGDRQSATFTSPDGGAHWSIAPSLAIGQKSPAVYPSPLAASGTSFLLGTNQRGFWRLGLDARRWAPP
jgi:Sortilin, neurotensin receptor 3,